MIRLQEHFMILRPRAFVGGEEIHVPLERGYTCPGCDTLIYGVFETSKGRDHLVNLNHYAFDEALAEKPDYKVDWFQIPYSGIKYQQFYDEFHCGQGSLHDRVAHLSVTRCKYVKFFYEPNYQRLMERIVKDFATCEIQGFRHNGKFLNSHGEILRACQSHVGTKPENIFFFLQGHPFGRFVPDVSGKGPHAYMTRYAYEQAKLHQYYQQVLATDYECVHQSNNPTA